MEFGRHRRDQWDGGGWLLPSPAGLSRTFASGTSEVSRFSCMEFSRRAWGLRLRRADQQLALSPLVVLPSATWTASGPDCRFSKLDTQPIFSAVYASLDISQRPVQNSGPSGLLLLSRKALASHFHAGL